MALRLVNFMEKKVSSPDDLPNWCYSRYYEHYALKKRVGYNRHI